MGPCERHLLPNFQLIDEKSAGTTCCGCYLWHNGTCQHCQKDISAGVTSKWWISSISIMTYHDNSKTYSDSDKLTCKQPLYKLADDAWISPESSARRFQLVRPPSGKPRCGSLGYRPRKALLMELVRYDTIAAATTIPQQLPHPHLIHMHV